MTDDESNSVDRARALLEVGRDAEAAEMLRRNLESRPDDPTVLGLLAEALRPSDPRASYEAARAALGCAPTSVWAHVIASWSASADHRASEARGLVQTAIALDPDSAIAHQAAAQILAKDAVTREESLASARRAIELAPHDPTTWIAAGNASVHAALIGQARQYFEYALRLDPNNRTALGCLAAVEEHAGSLSHAMDLMTAIIRLDPSNHQARSRIDSLARGLIHELLWLSVPVGVCLAVVVSVATGAP